MLTEVARSPRGAGEKRQLERVCEREIDGW